jgi:alpha-beta hydrolase superfamily lysophospholipase
MTVRLPLALAQIPLTLALFSSCASHPSVSSPVPQPALHDTSFTSFDGDRFPYHKWLPKNGRSPRTVVIGFHGIAGASSDLSTLGEHLQEHLPGVAVYAPDLRGQGNDPITSRKGDIRHAHDWYRDIYTFTRLVREQHPGSRMVWCGESMGSLIALHATASATQSSKTLPCDALILSSPITRGLDDFPKWKQTALRWGASLFPKLKISLESLSGEDEVRVIKDVVHQDQVATNSYHVSAFTLRLLFTLGTMIETLPAQAGKLDLPVLLLHGGHDIFSKAQDVEDFASRFPPTAKVQRTFYPESYHLLFYDHQREKVLADITRWLRKIEGP